MPHPSPVRVPRTRASRPAVLLLCALGTAQPACGAGAARPLSAPPRSPICRNGTATCNRSQQLPRSIRERKRLRGSAQNKALLGSVFAIPAGLALTAAALYASTPPAAGESVVDQLEDGAKNAGARMALGAGGLALTIGGMGLLVQGTVGRLFPDPLIIDVGGKPTLIDPRGPPSGAVQLDAHLQSNLAWLRPETEFGLGIAHWVSPRCRLRYSIAPAVGFPLSNKQLGHLGVSVSLQADWNRGRRRNFGRIPGGALSFYVASRALLPTDDPLSGESLRRASWTPGWRAGVGWSTHRGTVRLGASQIIAHDEHPLAELSYTVTLPSL